MPQIHAEYDTLVSISGIANWDLNTAYTDGNHRIVTTQNVQNEIMLGTVYRFSYRVASLAAAASFYILFNPTDTDTIYKGKWSLSTLKSSVTFEGFEDATVSDLGVLIPVYNMNRNATSLTDSILYHTPTVSETGDKYLPDSYIYADESSQGQLSLTTSSSLQDEWSAVFNPTKKYLYKITNVGDTATAVTVSGRYIEEKQLA